MSGRSRARAHALALTIAVVAVTNAPLFGVCALSPDIPPGKRWLVLSLSPSQFVFHAAFFPIAAYCIFRAVLGLRALARAAQDDDAAMNAAWTSPSSGGGSAPATLWRRTLASPVFHVLALGLGVFVAYLDSGGTFKEPYSLRAGLRADAVAEVDWLQRQIAVWRESEADFDARMQAVRTAALTSATDVDPGTLPDPSPTVSESEAGQRTVLAGAVVRSLRDKMTGDPADVEDPFQRWTNFAELAITIALAVLAVTSTTLTVAFWRAARALRVRDLRRAASSVLMAILLCLPWAGLRAATQERLALLAQQELPSIGGQLVAVVAVFATLAMFPMLISGSVVAKWVANGTATLASAASVVAGYAKPDLVAGVLESPQSAMNFLLAYVVLVACWAIVLGYEEAPSGASTPETGAEETPDD